MMTLVFSLLPEAGIILLLEFYDPNWVNFDHFICQIDPYSASKIGPEFRVKYVDPGFRVNLTQFASVAYYPGSGSRFDPIWVKFDPDVFRV